MKLKILAFLILILIVILGSYLRLANLESNPNGLYVDEASTGYNAWAILLTGKDEYGKEFPVFFRFLGSYTPPLYTYLTSGAIHFFGFNIWSVRLVSAISGILLILVSFILIKSLGITKYWLTPLIGTFFLAVSPWSIFYSRIGYEINLGFLNYTLGLLFLWLSIKNKKWFIPAGIVMALSVYTYQAERLLAPLTFIIFIVIFKEYFLKKENRKILVLTIILIFLISLPQILLINTPASSSRGFGLFYSEVIDRQSKQVGFLLAFLREFFSQYFAYFSPRNLFFQPDSDLQRSLPELSTFYSWMVFLYFTGIYFLLKLKSDPKKFILMSFLLTPIPAALTGDPFSTQRVLPLLLPVTLIIIIGLDKLISIRPKLVPGLVIFLCLFSLLHLYRSYAVLLPNERAKIWGYGFEQLAREIQTRPNEKFLIDTSRIKPAYIELAFFLKYPPSKLQEAIDQTVKTSYYQNTKWENNYNFGQIEIRDIDWEEDIYKNQILVGDELAISENQMKEHFLEKIFEIRDPINMIIFQGFKTNPSLKCNTGFNKEKCSI